MVPYSRVSSQQTPPCSSLPGFSGLSGSRKAAQNLPSIPVVQLLGVCSYRRPATDRSIDRGAWLIEPQNLKISKSREYVLGQLVVAETASPDQ